MDAHQKKHGLAAVIVAVATGVALIATPSARGTDATDVEIEYDVWTETVEPEPSEAQRAAWTSGAGKLATARCRFTMYTIPLDAYANLGYQAWFYDPNGVLVDSQANWQYKPGLSGYLLAENVQPGEYHCVVDFYLEANFVGTDEAWFLGSSPTSSDSGFADERPFGDLRKWLSAVRH